MVCRSGSYCNLKIAGIDPSSSCSGVAYIAHRWIYEQYYGSLNPFYDLHHKCENTLCVNPDHMKPKTRLDHTRGHFSGVEHSIERKFKESSGHKRKLSSEEADELIELKSKGKTYKYLEERFNVAPGTIHRLWSKGGYAVKRYGEQIV